MRRKTSREAGRRGKTAGTFRIVAIYLGVGSLWILLSDRFFYMLFPEPEIYALIQTLKGWFYVIGTALLLAALVARELHLKEVLLQEKQAVIEEKDLLLRELHHRVKNNLQLILSLLNLQIAKQGQDSTTKDELKIIYQRIISMAKLHESLYNSESLVDIRIDTYLQEMIKGFKTAFNLSEQQIEIISMLDPLRLTIESALPMGMIVNELLLNAIQHAFTGKESGRIEIIFKKVEDGLELLVKDNGIGIPEGYEHKQSLGISIIRNLVNQLDGTLTMQNSMGTEFRLSLPGDQVHQM